MVFAAPLLNNPRPGAASQPNRVWVTDVTFVPTRRGWLYVAAMTDLFSRRIVGWSMGSRLDQQLVIDALRMALEQRQPEPGLIHHSDAGVQYRAIRYTERLAEADAVASVGTVGDSYDCQSVFAASREDEEVLAGVF